jgi:hypothetical protein
MSVLRSVSAATPVVLLAGLLAGLLTCGPGMAAQAASTRTPSIAAPLPANALPVPPQPRKSETFSALEGFAPAPVPNPDLQRPLSDILADRPRTEVVPSLFNKSDRRGGEGYVRGSAAQYDPDHRFNPSPGINLKVPLQ